MLDVAPAWERLWAGIQRISRQCTQRPFRREPAPDLSHPSLSRMRSESLEPRLCLSIEPVVLLPDDFGPQQTGEWTVAASQDYRAIGVPQANDGSTYDTGFAAVYDSANDLIATIQNPDPQANDEFGKAIALSGDLLAVSAQFDDVDGVPGAGSVFIYDVSSAMPSIPVWTLPNPDPHEFDGFGNALALDGDTLVVAAMDSDTGASGAGIVTVFDLSSATPAVPLLVISNPQPNSQDRFGWTVAVEGQTIVVGALFDDATAVDSGSAHVFDLSSLTPTIPVTTLNHPTPAQAFQFAGAIAISGTRVLIGSRLDDVGTVVRAGAVHLYDLASSTPETAVLTIQNPDPRAGVQFGFALDLDGETAVVGAWLDGPGAINAAGSAYVFQLDSASPTIPSVVLQEPMPQPVDEFGYAVAVSGTTVIASSRFNSSGIEFAYVYDLTSAVPDESVDTLQNVIPAAQDRFGFAVSIDGNLMAVSAPLEDDASINSGAIYVYDLSSGVPVLSTRLFSPTPSASETFGISIVVSGSRIAVGASRSDVGEVDAGSVFVYDVSSATPDAPVFTIHNPAPAPGDQFGRAVDLDGDDLIVGANSDDAAATDSGAVYIFDLGSNSPSTPLIELQHPTLAASAEFGRSVAIDDGTVVVGSPTAEGVFAYDLTSQTPQVPTITFSDPTPASPGLFGYAVAIDKDHVVVGAPLDEGQKGAAYVFRITAEIPGTAIHSLNRDEENVDDLFGFGVTIEGSQVLVSAPREDTGAVNAGRVFVYDLDSSTPATSTASLVHATPTDGLSFGDAVALSGGVQLVGVSLDSTVNYEQGAVYAYIENTLPTIDEQLFSVSEDDDGGQPFATIFAVDAESGVTFSISGGDGQSSFSVDAQSGDLTSNGPLDFELTDTYQLEVTVTDAFGGQAIATVTISVTNVNESPLAFNPNLSQPPQGAPLSEDSFVNQQLGVDVPFDLFATDVDSVLTAESFSFEVADVTIGGSTTTFTTLSDVGISYDRLTGQFLMDPAEIDLFQSLAGDESAEVLISFTVSDGELSDTGTVTFSIFGVNDAPWAVEDSATTDQNTSVDVLDVLANDSDIEGDTLAITEIDTTPIEIGVPVTLVSGAIVWLNTDATLSYDPNGAFDLHTASTDDFFSYTVSDGMLSSTAQVTLILTIANEAPLANPDSGSTDEDTELSVASLGVLSNDIDGDAHDMVGTNVLVSSYDPSSALGATVFVAADGGYTYDPRSAVAIQSLDVGLMVDDTFSYTISDSQGEMSTAVVTITLTGVNDAPLGVDDTLVTDEDVPFMLNVLVNDMDVDGSSVLTVTEVTQGTSGAVAIVANQIEYTPAADYHGPDSFTYTVSDEHDVTSVVTVMVIVTDVNDTPVALDDTAGTQGDVVINVLANDDAGAANESSQTLTVISTSEPAHGSVVINPDGTLTYTPEPSFSGSDSFTYTVEDDGTTGGLLDPQSAVATVVVEVSSAPLLGDFNDDTLLNCDDANLLSAAIATSSSDLAFDMTGDTTVSFADLIEWLAIAGAENLIPGASYVLGDANLDGAVEGGDFLIWNTHKFTLNNAYCSGDFNADGEVSGEDFLIWNTSKFTAEDRMSFNHGSLADKKGPPWWTESDLNRNSDQMLLPSTVVSSFPAPSTRPFARTDHGPATHDFTTRRFAVAKNEAVFECGLLACLRTLR